MPWFERFWRRSHRSSGESRRVCVAHKQPFDDFVVPVKYPSNKIITSKYTFFNFLPKNLLEQFRRIANFYFLCVAIVQLSINSPVSPATSLLPLIFVVLVTAIKQAYEDWVRHEADKVVNTSQAWVFSMGKFVSKKAQDIKVGDIVKIEKDDEVPCDMVPLSSSEDDGRCYITTANLDGEANLKVYQCSPSTCKYPAVESFDKLTAVIECESPHPDLYKFVGQMTVYTERRNDETVHSLGPVNLLLKGSKLKNTSYVYGCAVYTGQDTKMALNLGIRSNKFSTVEKSLNKYLVVFLCILFAEAAAGTILMMIFNSSQTPDSLWYMPPDKRPQVRAIVEDFLSFVVLFNYIIPISLYVSLEMVKFIGSRLFVNDKELFDDVTGEFPQCNSSDLNEELGQIQYLFSDKTGTLTENEMFFRRCWVNCVNYEEEKEGQLYIRGRPLKSFSAELQHFLVVVALCNTVQVNELPSDPERPSCSHFANVEYQASSSDEKALVEACARLGVVLQSVSNNMCEIRTRDGLQKFEKLATLEFDSDRRKMSVIVQDERGSIYMICKGADSAILDGMNGSYITKLKKGIRSYAKAGLRVLVIAEKKMGAEDYQKFIMELNKARHELTNREDAIKRVYEKAERNFTVLGATGIEDRLQDGVEQTLDSLRMAGIKVWVLTGDSLETAVSVSNSCGHFTENMKQLVVTRSSSNECHAVLEQMLCRVNEEPQHSYALIIDGYSLIHALQDSRDVLTALGEKCSAVLCCRMSPLQKAEVVKLVKQSRGLPVTAAIGDGANDVSMIQEAHVGLGIIGKEGRQAARCSDFAISKFHFLHRVILIHGQYYYVRIATLVLYCFYKNIAFVVPQFIFLFFNNFSPQPIYNSIFLMMYNIFFTSLPILVYSLTDKHASEDFLLEFPQVYKRLSKNACLTTYQFMKWFLFGLWHSIIFFFGTYYIWGEGIILHDGKTLGLWAFGATMFHVVVIGINVKLALLVNFWTKLFAFSLFASIIGFMGFTLLYSSFYWSLQTSLLYGVYLEVIRCTSVWFGTLILIYVALALDVLVDSLEQNAEDVRRVVRFVCTHPNEEWLPLLHNHSCVA